MNNPPTARKLALQALQIAQGYANAKIHEEGGNNRGDQVEFFQHLMGGQKGDPWCADFVCTCLVKAYAQLTGQPEGRADLPHYVPAVNSHYFHLSGSCEDLWKSATQHYMARSRMFTPLPGDIALFDFDSVGVPHHSTIVKAVLLDGSLYTIEGNTSSDLSGSQADGDGVFEKTRRRNCLFGIIHFG